MARIGVLIGSLGKDSYSRKVVDYFTALPTSLESVELSYSISPFYNPDLGKESPIEWQAFKKATNSADALLIVTQEYSYLIPGGLENVLDVLSVPPPNQRLMGKPILVVINSTGERGGIIANTHLHQVLRYLGMRVMNCIIAIGNVQSAFKDSRNHDVKLASYLAQDIKDSAKFIGESSLPCQVCIDMRHSFCYSPSKLALLDGSGTKIATITLDNSERKTVVIGEVTVAPEHRGQGLVNKIMTTLVWLAERADRQVKANCPFAKSYLETHPQF